MISKKPKLAFQFLIGAFVLAFTFTACNNSGEKKETKTDSVVNKIDTTHIDTSIHGKPTAPGD